jgi:hypothetical protein
MRPPAEVEAEAFALCTIPKMTPSSVSTQRRMVLGLLVNDLRQILVFKSLIAATRASNAQER